MATEVSQWTNVSFALILPFDARAVDEHELRMLKITPDLTDRKTKGVKKTRYRALHDALWKPIDASRPKGMNGSAIQNHRQRHEVRKYTHSVKLQEALKSSSRYVWYPGYRHSINQESAEYEDFPEYAFPRENADNRFAIFAHWSGGSYGKPAGPEPELGQVTLNAAEVLIFDDEPLAYLVLHLHQKTDQFSSISDEDLADLMVRMRRPGLKGKGRPVLHLDRFMEEINLRKIVSDHGNASYTWGGFLDTGKEPETETPSKRSLILRDRTRAFLLTHAIPVSGKMRGPALFEEHSDWPIEQRWAFLATDGVHPEATLRLPPRSKEAATNGSFERNTYHARIGRDGFALIGDAKIDGSSSTELTNQIQMDRWATQCLMHTRLVDLAILAQRQKMQLDLHAESLKLLWGEDSNQTGQHHASSTELALTSVADRARNLDRQLRHLQEQQERLAYFRNRYWIRDVSGHPDDSEFLQRLQDALGSPQALEDVVSEQTALYEYVSAEQRAAEARIREVDQEASLEQQHQLELILAIFVPASVIPAIGALFVEPSLGQGLLWFIFTLIFTAFCVLLWHLLSRRS